MKTSSLTAVVFVSVAAAQQTAYGQCGGIGWAGATTCVSGYTCTYSGDYYSQCIPGSGNGGTPATTLKTTTTTKPATSSTPTSKPATGKTQFAGVNVAGFDFGVTTDGSQTYTKAVPPISGLGGPDGIAQMTHFVKDDHMNVFRLPVGWQYLTKGAGGGSIDAGQLANYDRLVQGCLGTGASCIIDIHNYARFNGQIIGQGGPSDDSFVSLWTQIATKYKGNSKIIFGVMNEPHDVNINTWAATVQKVVNAIRNTGATSQLILLPGNDYTSAGAFISNGSGAALIKVTNPGGGTTGLIFDVHKYLDSDNSGTHTECVKDNVSDAFQPLATWLRQNNRQAILSETGGGNTASCIKYVCQEISFINQNSDVYLGYVGWAAGSFDQTYELVETPTGSGTNMQDTSLVKACLAR